MSDISDRASPGATPLGESAETERAERAEEDSARAAARARKRARQRRGRTARLSAAGLVLFLSLFRLLPISWALFFARRLGALAWWLLPSRRAIADENLKIAFGDRYTARERRRIGRRSIERFAMTIIEGVLLPDWIRTGRLRGLVREGPGVAGAWERQQRGEPLLFFTGHFGAWEVGVRHLVRKGWRIAVPYRSTKNEFLQDWIVANRGIAGPEQFHRKGALRAMVRVLRSGGAVTMFLDQNERNGIFVDFFGRPAATVPTVGALADRCDAAVYLQVVRRITPGKDYTIDFEGPLEIPEGGTPEERVAAWTQLATRRIELRIRELPEDWLWIHRRWRTQPPAEAELSEKDRGDSARSLP